MLDRVHTPAPALNGIASAEISARAAAADFGTRDLQADIQALSECRLTTAVLPSDAGGYGYGTEPTGTMPLFDVLRELGDR